MNSLYNKQRVMAGVESTHHHSNQNAHRRCTVARTIVTLMVVFLSSFVMGQDTKHAPTAEQCKADRAVWETPSRADVNALPIHTLLERADYLYDCENVLLDARDID